MVSGNLNGRILRAGLSVFAALLVSTTAFAQEATDGSEDVVMYPVLDGGPIIVVDDGFILGDGVVVDDSGNSDDVITDDGSDEGWTEYDLGDGGTGDGGTGDDGTGDDGTGDGGTGDGGTGDGGTGDNGTGDNGTGDGGLIVIDDGEVVIYYMYGDRPLDCPECRDLTLDLPVEAYQMSAGGPQVADVAAAPTVKPRRSTAAPSMASSAAECLALHPQLPWLCEWQNNTGQ